MCWSRTILHWLVIIEISMICASVCWLLVAMLCLVATVHKFPDNIFWFVDTLSWFEVSVSWFAYLVHWLVDIAYWYAAFERLSYSCFTVKIWPFIRIQKVIERSSFLSILRVRFSLYEIPLPSNDRIFYLFFFTYKKKE